jgi:hypothetical protein
MLCTSSERWGVGILTMHAEALSEALEIRY